MNSNQFDFHFSEEDGIDDFDSKLFEDSDEEYVPSEGNFLHNLKVFERNEGKIIPHKIPTTERGNKIDICFGVYLSSDLWRHVKKCHLKGNEEKLTSSKQHQISSASLTPSTLQTCLEDFCKLHIFRSDCTFLCHWIRNYAIWLFSNHLNTLFGEIKLLRTEYLALK